MLKKKFLLNKSISFYFLILTFIIGKTKSLLDFLTNKSFSKEKSDNIFIAVRIKMSDNIAKSKSLQVLNDYNPIQNYTHEPLPFYLRDHKLYFTSLYGSRYNEEWHTYAEVSFCQHLKIIKAYHALVQDVNNHLVLIIMPTWYIQTF